MFYVELKGGARFVWRNYTDSFVADSCRYFLFRKLGNVLGLTESPSNLDHTCASFFAQDNTLVLRPLDKTTPVLSDLLRCCNLDPSLSRGLAPPLVNLHHLSLLAAPLFDLYQKKIAVVEFRGARGRLPSSKTGKRYFVAPGKCIFELVALVAPSSQLKSVAALNPESLDLFVCSFASGSRFCLLSRPYCEAVKKMLYTQVNEDVTRDKTTTLEVGAGGPNLFGQTRGEEQKSRRKKIADKKSGWKSDRLKRFCTCESCLSREYDANMSRGGPEKLLTHKLTLDRLVKIMGVDNEETRAILEQLSRLSVASFDIESMTVPLDHVSTNAEAPLSEIDSATRSQQALALQKPIMLAHRDALMHSADLCQVFTLESDGEASVYKMVKDYWKFVMRRRSRVKTLKEQLARPLLDLCKRYEKVYFDYAQAWRDPAATEGPPLELSQITSGWRHSFPGRLQSQLKRLIGSYEIFSFYGSGYDHILLQAYLVPYLYEKRLKPRLEKTGNKISAIRVNKLGITFRDVVKLLAPGTSLRQFGQLFKLKQEKAHFPFGLLSGVEALKIAELPPRAEDWQCHLSVSKVALSQSEVDESLELYRQSGCLCLGDYLRTYLRLDVDILYAATQGWRQMMAKEIGVDFVQTGNYTISSVSNLAGDQRVASNLQFGQFFPNNSAVYRLLRKGMRG